MPHPENLKNSSTESLWYKDAIIYQVHVRSFYDSNDDGIGDFRGLTENLDYIENLGVTAIWILPFYPSPLKDDGYDIADYRGIHPSYGSMRDFNQFLKKAHDRGLKVITELVINHTSDQHEFFQRARRAPKGSRERDFYVWSETQDKYAGTRIIFKDFESSNWTLDPVAKEYYWHRFYSHQPDLNYDSPDVQKEIYKILDMWLDKGVDGLRLDAIPYLFEREGTSCENLPETHQFLKELRAHIDSKFKDRMLLAEANMWPEDVVQYLGQGDECHMAFHFPIMPRLFMAIRMENYFPIMDILQQTPDIPENTQWTMFLRNHDELTLEMVTDKERDYMYQVYAHDPNMRINLGIRRRLAPLLGNDRRQIELLNSLLFSLPGTPVIYNGDEIGMGDNVFLGDRNGVRTPMQWSADINAGFSRANPQRLYLPVVSDPEYHYQVVNVRNQEDNRQSLLWWMRHIINLRKRFKAFGRGSIKFLPAQNPRILAFVREYENECILIVANLSRYSQYTELDLSEYAGMVPLELFGQTELPMVSDKPYFLTLSPYGFYWFALQPQNMSDVSDQSNEPALPEFQVKNNWNTVLTGRRRKQFEKIIGDYVKCAAWFTNPNKRIQDIRLVEDFKMSTASHAVHMLIIRIDYMDSSFETYFLPITFIPESEAADLLNDSSQPIIASVGFESGQQGYIYDAFYFDQFALTLSQSILIKRRFRKPSFSLQAVVVDAKPCKTDFSQLKVNVTNLAEGRVTFTIDEKYVLRIFRRLEAGISPDFEMTKLLTEKKFPHTLPLAGALNFSAPKSQQSTIAVLFHHVKNQGQAWEFTLHYLVRNYERAASMIDDIQDIPKDRPNLYHSNGEEPSEFTLRNFGMFIEYAKLLGHRLAELHLALGSADNDKAFKPEPFTAFYQHSQYKAIHASTKEVMRSLYKVRHHLPEADREIAERVLDNEKKIIARFRPIRNQKFTSMRMRVHGDHSLGKLLYTGKGFLIWDFHGESGRSVSERHNKISPLWDVATMLRSAHYASLTAIYQLPEGMAELEREIYHQLRDLWYSWTSRSLLQSYLVHTKDAPFVPKDSTEIQTLLEAYTLERALYELGFELESRLDWARIPLEAIDQIISTDSQ